jgi:glycosyltransferase involved in cell wall biosynthesis/TPR repeat protein
MLGKLRSLLAKAAESEPLASAQDPPKLVRHHFDSAYYRSQIRPEAAVSDDELFAHYVQRGWRDGHDPAAWFSVRDYLFFNADVDAAGIEPFYHFLAHGQQEGRLAPPSRGSENRAARFFADAYGACVSEVPPSFDADMYRLATGLAGTSRWVALAHFIRDGVFSPKVLAALRPCSDLLIAAGDCHSPINAGKALHCYELAAEQDAGAPALQAKLGDCHARLGLTVSARSAYRKAVEAGDATYATLLNLGRANRGLGQYDEALDTLQLARALRGADYPTSASIRQVDEERFGVEAIKALALSADGEDAEARALVEQAVARSSSLLGEWQPRPLRRDPRQSVRKVALLGEDSLAQCKLYRITQKIDQLSVQGMAIDFYSLRKIPDLLGRLLEYDCLIVYRAPVSPDLMEVVGKARSIAMPTMYDIDDLVFEDVGYPPPRETLQGMLRPEAYAGLVISSVLYREAMALCDFGIASTPTLQAAVAGVVRRKSCFLSRNALGRAHLAAIEEFAPNTRAENDRVVIFYGSGSLSHNANFAVLARPLADFLAANPQCELRVVGPLELGPEFECVGKQIVRLPTLSLADYWRELAQADVNLAPLERSRFNDAKSEIKWLEAAMLGVPSVVSRSAMYDDVITAGHDGFVVDDADGWRAALQRLVDEPKLGRQVGARAHSKVLRDYGMEEGGTTLRSFLDDALRQTAVLTDDTGSKPTILIVNIFYPPEDVGGATRVVEEIVTDVRDLDDGSLSFEVLCGHDFDGRPGSFERYAWNGVPVTSVSPFTDLDEAERSEATDKLFAALVERVRPDLIHFHCIQRLGISLLDVARQFHVPFVVTAHDGWWISDQQFLVNADGVPVMDSGDWGDPARLVPLKDALNAGEGTIAVSDTHARLYRERGVHNVVTIANGSRTVPGVAAAPAEGPLWLGLLGGIGMAKGSELLRDILRTRHYPNLSFLLIDHGMSPDEVRHELWGENRVEIRGKSEFGKVGALYSRLHVVLAVSVCVESFGLVAREAKRLGRWVIASSRGGMAEDVHDGVDGFIVDPARPETYAAVLDLMNAEPGRFRSPPPRDAELRSTQDVAADYLALYRSLLAGSEGASRWRASQ